MRRSRQQTQIDASPRPGGRATVAVDADDRVGARRVGHRGRARRRMGRARCRQHAASRTHAERGQYSGCARRVPGEAVLGIPVVGRGSNCLGYTGPQEGTASPALIVAMSCARGPYQDRARPQRSRGRARRGRSRRHEYGPSLEESESFDRCRYCPVGSDPGACSNSNCAVCRRPRRLPEKPRRGPKGKRQAQGGAAYFPRHLRLLTSIGLIHRPRASVARILNPTSAAASGHRCRFIWRL
jgi:hypothetical protein